MRIEHVRSMGLTTGVPIPHFDTVKEVLASLKNGETQLVDIINKYGRQKDSLVNARDYLSSHVDEKLGFKIKQKAGKDGKMEDDETESKHLDRFVAAAVKGEAKAPGLTVVGKDEKEKVESVWKFLQTIIDHAYKADNNAFAFDLNSTGQVGKPKKAPVWAVDAATSIINAGAKKVAEWTKKFTEGYESKGYGMVEPISFNAFDTQPEKGASAEAVEKTRTGNITNLAWAIVAVEDQKRANIAKTEYQ